MSIPTLPLEVLEWPVSRQPPAAECEGQSRLLGNPKDWTKKQGDPLPLRAMDLKPARFLNTVSLVPSLLSQNTPEVAEL